MNSLNKFFQLVKHPIKSRLFLLAKLPSAFFSGIRVKSVEETECSITVPYKWFSQNPFKSTYFACLAMAAETSTGILALANIYQRKPAVSMLVTNLKATFLKKAISKTVFTCQDGLLIKQAIEDAVNTKEAKTIITTSTGRNINDEVVAVFYITWSFKVKAS